MSRCAAKPEFIPIGCPEIVEALGLPGLPVGLVTTLIGKPDSGKTTLCIRIAAECQKIGGGVTIFDTEACYDERWAGVVGLDWSKAEICRPDAYDERIWCAEWIFGQIEAICNRKGRSPHLIVWDTYSQTPTAAETKEPLGGPVADHARLVSKALRTLVGKLLRSSTALLVVLQPKESVNTWFGGSGGIRYLAYRPWYHQSIIQLDLRRIGHVKQGNKIVGSQIGCLIRKNKKAPPFGECQFNVMTDCGIDDGAAERDQMLEAALGTGLITKRKAAYYYGDTLVMARRNRDLWRQFLAADPKLARLIRETTSTGSNSERKTTNVEIA